MRARLIPGSLERARRLRLDATKYEKKLWFKLREMNRHLGTKFRRQVPFRGYTLDFAEHGAKLVIELDGSQHGLPEERAHDTVRDGLLTAEGYKVLRFWNYELAENFEAVVNRILYELQQRSPTRKIQGDFSTSPQGGGAG
jgi:very-short-patch-repair endonuclease